MEMRDELRAKWDQSRLAGRGGMEWRAVLLARPAPLRILAAVREPDERTAILFEASLADAPVRRMHMTADGISLQDQRRPEEGLLRLAVTLEQDALRSIFEVLAQDLIEVAQSASSAAQAVSAIGRRLDAWQACLRQRRGALSREGQIGLIGELMVFRQLAVATGFAIALEAWQGPLDGLQDFVHAGLALEVKSVSGVSSRIGISHLEQLETQGLSGLLLLRLQFRESAEGRTLPELAAEIGATILREAPHLRTDFDEKLLRAGYVRVENNYDTFVRIALDEMRAYEVRDGFPRLSARMVTAGIIEAQYVIDERSLAPFRIGEAPVQDVMMRMKGAAI